MPRAVRALLFAIAITMLVLALRWLNLWERVSVESMRGLVDAWGPLGPLVFIGVFIAGFFIPGPEMLLVAVGGVLFGTTRGFAYAWIASVVGTTAAFVLVRYIAQAWAQRAMRERFPRLRAFDDRLERHGLATVVLLRLLLFLAPPLNWALGASRVRLHDYVLGTAIGILPGIGLVTFLADRITAAGSSAELLDLEIIAPAAVLALLVAAGVVVGRRLLGGSAAGKGAAGAQAHRRAAREHAAIESGEKRGR